MNRTAAPYEAHAWYEVPNLPFQLWVSTSEESKMTDLNRGQDMPDPRVERAKDKALGKHDDSPGVADHVGEAAGGVSGVVAGAAIGSAIGPVGTILGGIAGAMGGWWAGRALAEAATAITKGDDIYYRRHFE
jgi:hypothetical protein